MNKQKTQTGVVENIRFTIAGFGEQHTRIDGVEYWTWFDLTKLHVKVGSKVEYTPYDGAMNWNSGVIHYRGAEISRVL